MNIKLNILNVKNYQKIEYKNSIKQSFSKEHFFVDISEWLAYDNYSK
jgi:hypothetical protein